MNNKALIYFQTDINDIKRYNELFFSRSLFLRKCLLKAIYDDNFFYDILRENYNVKEIKEKHSVTFQIDKNELEKFNKTYFEKSLFLRKCLKKAINDISFFYSIMKENENESMKKYIETASSYKDNNDNRCMYEN